VAVAHRGRSLDSTVFDRYARGNEANCQRVGLGGGTGNMAVGARLGAGADKCRLDLVGMTLVIDIVRIRRPERCNRLDVSQLDGLAIGLDNLADLFLFLRIGGRCGGVPLVARCVLCQSQLVRA